MDPDVVWINLVNAWANCEWGDAADAAEYLHHWISEMKGFHPRNPGHWTTEAVLEWMQVHFDARTNPAANLRREGATLLGYMMLRGTDAVGDVAIWNRLRYLAQEVQRLS